MTRILIGEDSTGVECIKITKGDYSPVTTNDALRERFYFSSKWKDQLETPGMEICPYFAYSGERYVFFPSGTTNATFQVKRYDVGIGVESSHYYIRSTRFPQLRYDMPVVDVKVRRRSNGRFIQNKQREVTNGYPDWLDRYGGYLGQSYQASWFKDYDNDAIDQGSSSYRTRMTFGMLAMSTETIDNIAVVWNLPGNATSLDGDPTPPSPVGKKAVEIGGGYCRVAKPGYDVRTATPKQLAFDANGRPLGVLAAMDVAVPAGTSSVDLGMPVPTNTVAEVTFYRGSTLFYPARPSDEGEDLGADYWFDGNRIYFANTGVACRARFIVFASDDSGQTSGSYNVLRHFTAGGEGVVQFLRPGAGASPTYNDIIIDSRRPVIQILADGSFTVSNGVATRTIEFDATGFFPMVKFCTWHGAEQLDAGGNEIVAGSVRSPLVRRLMPYNLGLMQAGNAAWCTYNSTSATFYTAKGSPIERRYNSLGNLVYEYDRAPMIGIRWFVLGIPLP